MKPDLTLSDRIYKCQSCGAEMDRDWNAAANLAAYTYGKRSAENRKKKKEESLREELAKKLDEVDVTLKAADKMIDDAEEIKRLGQFP
jgi:hypothetical protein